MRNGILTSLSAVRMMRRTKWRIKRRIGNKRLGKRRKEEHHTEEEVRGFWGGGGGGVSKIEGKGKEKIRSRMPKEREEHAMIRTGDTR